MFWINKKQNTHTHTLKRRENSTRVYTTAPKLAPGTNIFSTNKHKGIADVVASLTTLQIFALACID